MSRSCRLPIIAATVVSAGLLFNAGVAGAATLEVDWPTCASLSVTQPDAQSFAATCVAGTPPATPAKLVFDLPMCPNPAIRGRGDELHIDCGLGTTTNTLTTTIAVSGCNDVSVWGGSDRGGTDCIADAMRRRVQDAYVAYYGRPGDPGGVDYWTQRLIAEGGALETIINAFATSAEFNLRYAGLSNIELVTKVYQQTLGRDPEQTGLNYYVDRLTARTSTLGTIALNVLDGALFDDATVVANRLHVADYYTAKVAAGCAYGTASYGASLLSAVLSTNTSVAAALIAIDTHCSG